MTMYRCRICGETYLGNAAPTQCPFCGAHRRFMISPQEYPSGINDVELTEQERTDLEASVELERSNTRFYLGMAQRKDNDTLRSAYKRLSRVESEHCSLFCKLLDAPKPADITEPGETTGAWASDIEQSVARETKARALYTEFAGRATSGRLREVFEAVAAVENDHLELDEVAKQYV